MALCKNLPISGHSLKIVNSSLFCRYHRSKAGYPISRLTTAGLCPEAFHSLYPLAFSMLYTDIDGHISQCNCPGVDGNIVFQLVQRPVPWMHRLCNGLKKGIHFIYPSEIICHKVFIEVKQPNPACPYNYRKGSLFIFNLGKEKEICPAAFYNIFPSIILSVYADDITQTTRRLSNSLVYACPDHRRNILFKLQDGDERIAKISEMKEYQCCKPLSNLIIDAKTVTGICPKAYKAKDRFMLRDIFESLDFPCLAALHTAYPYIYTLLRGGRLGFYTHNYDSAIVQCPDANAKVEMEVKRTKINTISIRISNLKNACPMGLTKGLKFLFSFEQLNRFCLPALMAMYPYLINYDRFLSQEVNCPGEKGKVCFSIHKLT